MEKWPKGILKNQLRSHQAFGKNKAGESRPSSLVLNGSRLQKCIEMSYSQYNIKKALATLSKQFT